MFLLSNLAAQLFAYCGAGIVCVGTWLVGVGAHAIRLEEKIQVVGDVVKVVECLWIGIAGMVFAFFILGISIERLCEVLSKYYECNFLPSVPFKNDLEEMQAKIRGSLETLTYVLNDYFVAPIALLGSLLAARAIHEGGERLFHGFCAKEGALLMLIFGVLIGLPFVAFSAIKTSLSIDRAFRVSEFFRQLR